jgi:hypothetical protein
MSPIAIAYGLTAALLVGLAVSLRVRLRAAERALRDEAGAGDARER